MFNTYLVLPRGAAVVVGCAFLVMVSCAKQPEPPLLKALRGDWVTTNILGNVETVRFEERRIVWQCGTENQYECPFKVVSYHETERRVRMQMLSKRRSGSNTWILHRLLFTEGLDEFTMAHGDRFESVDGVFTAKKN